MLSSVQMVGRVTAEVAGDLDRLADRAAAEVAARVPEYQRALTAAGEDPRAASMRALSLLLGGLESREAVPSAAPNLRREGAARCEAGVALDTLLEVVSVEREVLGRAFEEAAREQSAPERTVLGAERRLDRLVTACVTELARGYMAAYTERWRRQHDAVEAVMRVAAAVNRSVELADVAQTALGAIADGLAADAAALWLRGEESDDLVLTYTHRLRWDEDRDLRATPVAPIRLLERAIRAGSAVAGELEAGGKPVLASAAAVAVRSRGLLLGVLVVGDREQRVFTQSQLGFLRSAADHVAAALVRATRHQHEARTDSLTGLANRGELERQLERAIASSRRHKRPLALVLVDLDGLKRINDEHGHAAGDEALQRLATTLQRALRSVDTCARIGGDEFAVVMPDTTADQAADVMRRVDRVLLQAGLHASLGVAGWDADATSASLFKLADQRLYRQKRRHHRVQEQSGGS